MARLGRESKSPEMLLAAARVIGTTNIEKLNIKKLNLTSKEVDSDPLDEVVALIKEAKELLAGDNSDAVAKLATAVEKEVKEFKRGRKGGAHSWTGLVDASENKTDEFHLIFNGKQNALIDLHNFSGEGDFDLFVYDLEGRLVARDSRNGGSVRVISMSPASTNTGLL